MQVNNIKSSSQDSDNEQYIALFKMLKERKTISNPNVDEQWIKFKKEKIQNYRKSRNNIYLMITSAMIGAAAIFILLFTLDMIDFKKINEEPYIAMTHSDGTQNIILQQNDQLINLTNLDSISYCNTNTQTVKQKVEKTDINKNKSKQQVQKLTTPRGMDFKVILPDGSEVILNSESTIEFPNSFLGNERHVKLKGEAFFKVAKNEKSPFIVSTDRVDVKVLGTEFNLKNYSGESPHVSLIKGSVDVYSNKSNKMVRMVPGKDVCCDENGNFNITDFDVFSKIQWINGYFYFDNVTLKDVMLELGRWYNMGIVFYNKKCMQYNIHFSALRNDDLKNTLSKLNKFNGINIKTENDKIVIY